MGYAFAYPIFCIWGKKIEERISQRALLVKGGVLKYENFNFYLLDYL
jgi:hypothetical protein